MRPLSGPSAGGPITLGPLRVEMRLGPGYAAHAVRFTSGLQALGIAVFGQPSAFERRSRLLEVLAFPVHLPHVRKRD
jgi:hypothetical protein